MVKIVVNDISTNAIALIDSGVDQNRICEGIIPTNYCERTKEQLYRVNREPLNIGCKLNIGYIQNNGYCFKNIFLIVQNITHDIIVGTPFLAQIYPFYVNDSGVYTKIFDKQISFNFLSVAKQREVSLLQNSSIYKLANLLQLKQNRISYLKDEISYKRIEEQLHYPSIQQKSLNLEQVFKRKICSDLPNAFWERKKHIISLPYEKDFDECNIPTRVRPTQMNS